MIKNVILDVGNVLVDYCWEKHLASFGFPADIAERVAKATALSEDWEEYDRGVLTDAEVLNRFIENDPGGKRDPHVCRKFKRCHRGISVCRRVDPCDESEGASCLYPFQLRIKVLS